eukprot:CAMPEP_0197577874 /NCGR_PEP_ID=MMETSP1326-20131121/2329_1 /TAXON_ID=1155430 /ORGANISM="Genus nov. species nov., Strain RCC2288" /LENGTH=643 /DNA_ID=CAMNT_0043140997 /DNA_START=76 /DNA_END=2007 /DNA_ORIENTATION=-
MDGMGMGGRMEGLGEGMGSELEDMMSGMGGSGGGMDDFDDDDGDDHSEEAEDVVIEYPDLEVGEEADISALKDGGIIKKVLEKGHGEDRPEKGQEVTVHYTGTLLDGTKFDSSVDRGDPFKFKMGVGQVIKGWDQGVASMRKGERAILTCTPNYAYGPRATGNIPANSTLQFEVELISWVSTKDLFNDGGCLRHKTLKRGNGYSFPKEIDEVTVVYSVTAADEGAAVIVAETEAEFAVKSAPFVGLAAVLLKMKSAESTIFRMRNVPGPQYLSGIPGAPAGEAVDVKVTLKSWKTVESICNGAGTKKTLTEGSGWDTPNDGAKCTVTYTATKLLSSGDSVDEKSEFTFVTGEDAVPPGLEEAVMKMKKGEVAMATVPAAFAYAGGGEATPGPDVVFTVTLTGFVKEKEIYAMGNPEKLEAAEKAKAAGNEAYKAGRLTIAQRKYDKALKHVEHDSGFTDDEKVKSKALKLSLYLNAAAVALKAKEWAGALKSAGEALKIEGSNEKALYRHAQAAVELEEYDEATKDVRKILERDENHKEAKALRLRIRKLEAVQLKKDAKLYGNMFGKLGGLYSEEEKAAGGLKPPDWGKGAGKEAVEEFDAAKASGDDKKIFDIGHGFTMKEMKDGEEGEEGDEEEEGMKEV